MFTLFIPMSKEFPLLFPDLVNHFNAIKGSTDDPDETDYEWSEDNFNFKVKEYPPDDYIPSSYNVLNYKNKFYRCAFDGHVIDGYLSEEIFDEYEDTYFDEEDTCAGEWIKIYQDSSREDIPEGCFLFEIPSIEEILDGGKKEKNEYISEDHEIITEWVDEIDEEDFKNIVYGIYGIGREVLFDNEFVIKKRYNG